MSSDFVAEHVLICVRDSGILRFWSANLEFPLSWLELSWICEAPPLRAKFMSSAFRSFCLSVILRSSFRIYVALFSCSVSYFSLRRHSKAMGQSISTKIGAFAYTEVSAKGLLNLQQPFDECVKAAIATEEHARAAQKKCCVML